MRDPYWETVHTALGAWASSKTPVFPLRPTEVDPGDVAYCFEGTRFRYILYEYLESRGFVLTGEEQKIFEKIKQDTRKHCRPCVVLGRHGPGSYVVCFLASLNSDSTPGSAEDLSIPCDDQEVQLRTYPPSNLRLLLALPVVRSNLWPVWGARRRQQLAYGEFERALTLVRAKVVEIKANIEEIRSKDLALSLNLEHPANRPWTPKVKVVQPKLVPTREPTLSDHDWLYRKRPFTYSYMSPHHERQNIEWIVRHGGQLVADASRYLSSVVRSPPPFHLPPPFYAPLLRASTAFIRRRIY